MKNIQRISLLIFALFSLAIISKAQTEEMNRVKVTVINIFKNEVEVYDKINNLKGNPKNIQILEDRIEFKIKRYQTIINLSDLFNTIMSYTSTEGTDKDGKKYIIKSELHLKNCILYFRLSYEADRQLHHDLGLTGQQREREKYASQLISFETVAAEYRSLNVKPPIPEEQRKYIVQANGFNEQKMYDKAVELYKKAIEVDQTSYPAAYSNLALLSAQLNRFNAAIYYMKKYLMLEPEASDARSAQDKIYLWETQIIQ
jgi:tetratricopeptide (TPR) repeat protein